MRRTSILSVTLLALACAKGEAPSAPPPAPTAPQPTSAPAPVEAAVDEPVSKDSIFTLVGTVAKIEIEERSLGEAAAAKKYTLSDPAKVAAALTAIDLQQIPNGARRRCPDTIVLHFQDAGGVARGGLGLCNTTTINDASALEGPEAFAGPIRGGVKLADEAALKKLLIEARGG